MLNGYHMGPQREGSEIRGEKTSHFKRKKGVGL